MDASLDILVTTMKQRLPKQRLQWEADAAHEASQQAGKVYSEAEKEWKTYVYATGLKKLVKSDVTRTMVKLIRLITGVELRAESVWGSLAVERATVDEDYLFDILGYPVLKCSVSPDEDRSGNVTTHLSFDGGVKLRFSLARDATFKDLNQKYEIAKAAKHAALVKLTDVKKRLAGHGEVADSARVQMQRQKLAQMGAAGNEALSRIDNLLGTQDGGLMNLL